MIIPVRKYLVLGAKEDLDAFFAKAQKQGIIEFIHPRTKKALELPLEMQRLASAMRILRKLPVKKRYEADVDLQLADEVAIKIIELKAEVERLSEEKRLLEAEIVRVAPFGDFSLDDLDFIERVGNRKIQFFCMKTDKAHKTPFDDNVIYVGSEYDLDYFIAINKDPKHYPDMIEMRIDRPVGELQTHLSFVKESLQQIEAELKGFAGHMDFLNEAFVERLNDFNLAAAKKDAQFPLHNAFFAIEAWVPENKTQILYSIMDNMAVYCEPILIEENDRVPTYMENKGVRAIGEDLVHIYDTPATTDRDPSGWVFWFFVLFFSMIVADGGYGLLYLGLCLYIKYKYPALKAGARRFLKLAMILSTGCIVWGLVTTSFFGIQFNPKGWVSSTSILQKLAAKKAQYHMEQKDDVYRYWTRKFPQTATATTGQEFLNTAITQKGAHTKYVALKAFTDNVLLEFSLLIGLIHISLSLLRYLWRHWAGLGWVIFLVGAYLYFPSILKATSMVNFLGIMDKITAKEVGLQLIYTGIALAMFLSLLQKRWKGISEISTVIQVFADVLSYLRLYALGLAGVIMAETFNELGVDVGLFLGILLIIVGHSVNIMLGIMAGMIHGLRLNFIEWYHYCFVGGGRLFRPLMFLKAKEHI